MTPYRTPPPPDPDARLITCLVCGPIPLFRRTSCRTCGVVTSLEDLGGLHHRTRDCRCKCIHTGGSDREFWKLVRMVEGKPEPHEILELPHRDLWESPAGPG